MGIDLNPKAAIKIVECNIWKSLSVLLCLFLFMWIPMIFFECKSIKKGIKKIKQQQEKQGAAIEKVDKEKKQDQKIFPWIQK